MGNKSNALDALILQAKKTGESNPLKALSLVATSTVVRAGGARASVVPEYANVLQFVNPRLSDQEAYAAAEMISATWRERPEYAWGYMRSRLRKGLIEHFLFPETYDEVQKIWKVDGLSSLFQISVAVGLIACAMTIFWSFFIHSPIDPPLYDMLKYSGAGLFAIGLFGSIWRQG